MRARISSDESASAEEAVERLVGDYQIYAFGERTPGRKSIKPGDWICFYATGNGVIGYAKVTSYPENKPNKKVRHSEDYPWTIKLNSVKLFINDPIIINSELRSKLDAFKDRDLGKAWAWFVQATHQLTEKDFKLLTEK